MKRASVIVLTLWLLIIVMAASLILNLPDARIFATYSAQALIYAVLTAFTLYIGVLLSEGELSAAHVVGIVAFLSLPREHSRS